MKGLGWFAAVVGTLSLILVGVMCIVWWYQFSNEIEDYLKLAGDAPTVEKANEFLTIAVGNIERKELTSGNSAFFFHKPDADVGIWYQQIRGALETTDSLLARHKRNPNIDEQLKQLERDNTLMKIREVVLDEGGEGVEVTTPTKITWFPSQLGILIWIIVGSIVAILGWLVVAATWDSY